jgi:hypothetical protein
MTVKGFEVCFGAARATAPDGRSFVVFRAELRMQRVVQARRAAAKGLLRAGRRVLALASGRAA